MCQRNDSIFKMLINFRVQTDLKYLFNVKIYMSAKMSDGANFGNIQQKRIATYYDEKSSEISSLANLRISIEIYEWIDPSQSCGLNFHALIH